MNDFRQYSKDYLAHYGVSKRNGAKIGSGRYPLGSGKQGQKTVFVSGSSKTQDESSEYYRKKLPKAIRSKLTEKMNRGDKIIVGDAPGIDRQVQDYLNAKEYQNVEIYGPGKKVRYTANSKWKTNPIDAPEFEEGSKEWLAKKDIVMSTIADEGIAVILDEGAKATRKNIERMLSSEKPVSVYELNKASKELDRWLDKYGDIVLDDLKYRK